MPKDTSFSKAFDKAHSSINRSFQLALDKTGRVPIGHQILDPRTVAKHSAFDPSTIWNPIGENAGNEFDSKFVRPKDFDYKKHPLPKNPGKQSEKTAAGGKVVDPTAIETFQGADSVSLDTSSSGGISNNNMTEGA
jgi:hypothetical protein